MSKTLRSALSAVLLFGTFDLASAAGPDDLDWPCKQRKVEHLSLGVMWPHPLPEETEPLSPELEDVAARLALRRISEEEARSIVAELSTEHPEYDVQDFGRIFQAAFNRMDRQRAEIVEGISHYAQNQARFATEIEELRSEMAALEAADVPDFDRIDAIEAEIDWRVRIFSDRNRALTYVCESPVLLEQRAYAIARIMLEAAG